MKIPPTTTLRALALTLTLPSLFPLPQAPAQEILNLGNQSIGFGSTLNGNDFNLTGWNFVSGTRAVAGSTRTQTLSFNIWNENGGTPALVLAAPGGAADITVTLQLIDNFNPYNNLPLRAQDTSNAATGHTIEHSTAGLVANTRWTEVVASQGRTGDTKGARILVEFAPHIRALSDDFGVLGRSMNTAGTTFESTAIIYRWAGGIGSAGYTGFHSTPPLGPAPAQTTGLQQAYTIDTDPWTLTPGAFAAQSTGTVNIAGLAARTISNGSDGPFDGPTAGTTLTAAMAGVPTNRYISGFEWIGLVEDIRGLDADLDGTISPTEFAASTSSNSTFTATLLSMSGTFVTVPEPSRALLLALSFSLLAFRRRR